MMKLADRTTRIAGSPTLKVTATVDRLRRSGVDVIDFGAGEPDFPTPDAIKAAAHAALDQNFTRYTPAAGIADLRRAICDRYRADYGVDYSDAQSSSPLAASRRSTTPRSICSVRATK
jgi:aspartate aminotransferase